MGVEVGAAPELNFSQRKVAILLARGGGLVIGLSGMEKQVGQARQKRKCVEIEALKGCVFNSITGMEEQSIGVLFSGERSFHMLHESDCCEQVFLADVCGDPNDLLGNPIVEACEVSSDGTPPHKDADESWTWTFYRLSTIKGTVVLRWFGTSNGWYSEEVELYELQ